MLHGVNAGDIRATHRESMTDPIHSLPADNPSSAPSAGIYTLLRSNGLYILSCFRALLVIDARSECPLEVCLPVTMQLG